MRRPALYALVCFTCGIILGDFFDLPAVLLLSVLSLALSFSLVFLIRRETGSAGFFLILSLVLAGFFRYETLTRELPPDHVSNYLNLESAVTIIGQIAAEPDVRKDKTFLTVEAEAVREGQRTHSTSGRIILKIKEPSFKFDFADRIRFNGYLNEPTSGRNPGAFDYRRYLSRKGIWGMVSLDRANRVEILGSGERGFYRSRIVIPLRRWIRAVFDRTLSGNHQALLAGFLLGETRGISKEVYTMFRDTGTVHLLVVSGSNVWLVVGVVLGALSLLRVPRVPATLLGLVCILLFANLVNNDPPVVRAGIMAGVVMVGSLLYRDVDLINVVSFAGVMILFCRPLFLFDVGFQLSFVSVLGILVLYPRLSALVSKRLSRSRWRLWRWVIMPALVSVSVELALFPILAYYFNTVPTVVVLANVFIVPLAGLSVVLTCFSLFSAIFSISLAGIFSAANWLCLDFTLRLTQFFAGLPAAKLSLASPSLVWFILYYLCLWLVISSAGSKKKTYVFSALIMANLILWSKALPGEGGTLRLSLLDAGSGSASVLEAPNGETLVFNAGEKAKNLDAGEYIVIPFLNHEGVDKIDWLILTDGSSYNLSSALSVLQNREVKRLFMQDDSPPANQNFCDLMERWEGERLLFSSVQSITDPRVPFGIHFLAYSQPGNLGSDCEQIFVKIEYQDVSICLLDGMKRIRFSHQFEWQQVSNCSVLVLSELGEEEDILKIISAVRPEKIIFTRHYLRYEKDKIPLLMALSFPEIEYYRTAQGGAIVCQTRGKEIEVKSTLP